MKLELKESNSPFWLLGLERGKVTSGSSTNVPCYYKSSKKWYELASQIIKQSGIDEVYLLTGVAWDNLKGSWSSKEAGSYVQNKGKLILSKNEITSYDDKYGPTEIKEGDFPKGMSKDPLPKKGVKTYTSSATTLEGDGKMKLELKESNNDDIYIFIPDLAHKTHETISELWDDPDLIKKEEGKKCKIIKSTKLPGFEDTFEDTLHDIEFEDGTVINNVFGQFLEIKETTEKVEEALDPKAIVQGIMLAIDNWDELVKAITKLKELSQPVYDKAMTILQYLKDKGTDIKSAASEIANIVTTTEDFDISTDEEILEEGSTKLVKGEGDTFENAGTTWKVLTQNEEDTVIVALDSDGNERDKYVVAWGLQSDGSWNQGHYFSTKDKAMKFFDQRAKKNESLKESYSKDEFVKKSRYCTNDYDIYYLKNNKDNYFVMKKGETPWEHKELTQTDIEGVKHVNKLNLKESKIVEPVGNPQTAGSFVNIDIDLDHMEVSDFIIRLSQAIRSEQNAILEYTALRSANGITNEERTNIDSIIEEEKNHMIAITTMLYKQLLYNHTENVDKANDEFVLPKFGTDLFDEKSNLKESIETLLTKVENSFRTITQDNVDLGPDDIIVHKTTGDKYKIIAPEDGQVKVLNLKTNNIEHLSNDDITSGEYYDESESVYSEASAIRMSDEYMIGDGETGRMYYGLSQALDTIKNLITKSGDQVVIQNVTLSDDSKLTEDNFTNIDEFINELKSDTNYDEIAYHIHEYSKTDKKKALELMDLLFELEDNKNPRECVQEIINSIVKTEDTTITKKDNKYNIEVDVDYDSDVANQIFDNIAREVEDYNKNNDINLSELNLKDGKFYFTVNKEVDEKIIEDILNKIFDKATNYEYQISIA